MRKLRFGRLLPLSLLALGVSLLALGVMRGEHLTVLRKAAMICLECIGIG